MRRIFPWLFLLLIPFMASSQDVSERVKVVYKPGDSAVIIKEWILEGAKFSKTDSARAHEYFLKAIGVAQRNKDLWLLADAKMNFAEFLFSRQLIHRSFGNFFEAKEIYLKLDAPHELALATIGVAVILLT